MHQCVCVSAHASARACSEVKAAIGFLQEARAHMIIGTLLQDPDTSDAVRACGVLGR